MDADLRTLPRLGTAAHTLLLLASVTAAGCGDTGVPDSGAEGTVTVVSGARVFTGASDSVIEDATIVIEDGRISYVGPAAEADPPDGARNVDLTGRTVMPGLVNAHGHVGGTLGLESGHYTRENLKRQLELYAAYGVTTVVSLGGDGPAGVALRKEQDTPAPGRGRLFTAGEVITGDTPEEAIRVLDANVEMGVDFLKIRVDDNLGTASKMQPEVYSAVIERAHEHGLRLTSHLFYLDDAKGLLDAGTDLVAHSIRDRPVDDELIAKMLDRGVCYVPTLMREVSTFVYGDEPEFFADSFFLWKSDEHVLGQLRDPDRQKAVRDSPASSAYREALQVAQDNLAALAAAGVPIAFGTDTGPPGRFQGYFEHLELEMMAASGMSTLQVLDAATATPARCLGLDEVGTLEPGKWADFLVLTADPLEDVRNLRSIESVWIGGAPVDRGVSGP